VLAARSTPDRIGRPYVAPPKTPEDVMNILREAFGKAIADPELKADAKKIQMSLDYIGAADTVKILNEFLNLPPEVTAELGKYIKF
jgi:tripartite-type tricarboxylate transporter receptor subunit TctC